MTILNPTDQAIQKVASLLSSGGVAAFPTETVYGLGCDTGNEVAIEKVYALKKRPLHNPMIAHVLQTSWVRDIAEGWNETCDLLADAFWPGPLTIVLKRKQCVPAAACGGHDTIAVRKPNHRVAIALLEAFGKPISAPSANVSGYISPTSAVHVEEEFNGKVNVLDGGQCAVGIESTVLSLVGEPTILRPGSVSRDEISTVIGEVVEVISEQQVDSPGTSQKHYSPRIPARQVSERDIADLRNPNAIAIVITGKPPITKRILQMSNCPQKYATSLYSALREADLSGSEEIVIESPPNTNPWAAVHDRITRCCS